MKGREEASVKGRKDRVLEGRDEWSVEKMEGGRKDIIFLCKIHTV